MKNLIRTFIIILTVGFINQLSAQVGINQDNSTPDSTAILDVKSTDKGVLLPRMSDVQRDSIANPATGLTVFVTTDSSYYYFDGIAWTRLQSQSSKAFIAQNAGFPDSVLYTSPLSSSLTPLGLEVIGNYAYSFSFAFLQGIELDVYDISNPASINAVNNISLPGSGLTSLPVDMDVQGTRACILRMDRVLTIDVSSPTNPLNFSEDNPSVSEPTGIRLYNDDIAVVYSDVTGDFELVYLNTPPAIHAVSVGSAPKDVAFSGSYAFVVNDGNDQLEVIDLSVFNQASVVHTVSLGSSPVSVSISGNYAYVANNGNDKLEIIDISDPLTASLVHTVDLANSPTKVRTNDHYAFVLDDGNDLFQTIDISDPLTTNCVDTLTIGSNIQFFDIEGSYAFLLNDNGGTGEIQVISIPTDDRFFPLYDLDGNLIGYNNGSILSQKIDRFSLNGNHLELSISGDEEAPKSVDLSGYLDNTDAQSLALNTNTLSLTNGGSVNLDAYANDNTTFIQDADNDTKIQVEESADEDMIRFDVGGNEAWSMTGWGLVPENAGNGVFIGKEAGQNDVLLDFGEPTENTFIGHQAGSSNTTGSSNTFIGHQAGSSNTTGEDNTAIGGSALRDNVQGLSNVVVGFGSLAQNDGSNNTAVGVGIMSVLDQGDDNVGIGTDALRGLNGTGNRNVAIGVDAGAGNLSHVKTGSVYVGYKAGQYNEGDRNVFIGNEAAGSASWINKSNRLVIENSDADSTQALIFGEFDNDKLTINGTLRVNDGTQQNGYIAVSDTNGTMTWTDPSTISVPVAEVVDADNDTKIQVEENADEDMIRFDVGGAERAIIDENGNLGIGTSTPAAKLDIAGAIKITDGTEGSEKILKSDANGLASWGTLTGSDLVSTTSQGPLECPVVTASVATENGPNSVAVSGNFAYVANRVLDNTMQVIDISNPAAPAVVSSLATGNTPVSVAVSGNYAYVVNYSSNTMQVIDISNPAAPAVVGSLATGNFPRSVAVSGNYAYVVNYGPNTMQVIDVSTPTSPTVTGSVSTGTNPYCVSISGNYAYVVNYGSNTMQVIDISNPASPTVTGSVSTGQFPVGVTVSGNYAYVVNYLSNTMQVIDISNPALPAVVGSLATGDLPSSVAVSGNYAYVVNSDSSTMQVIDVSNPASPVIAGSVATNSEPRSVVVSGNYAYVANFGSDNMQVINLACPIFDNITVNSATGEIVALAPMWSASGNDISNANTGNVGIGTTTPDSELDVNGQLRIASLRSHGFTTGSNVIQVQATADTDQWIRFRRGGNPRGETGVIFSEFDNDHFFVNNVEDALAFSRSTENSATPDFANSNELMRLEGNGNLGIGTAAPTSKFHVEDNFTSNTSFVATIQNTANGGYANGLKIQAGENSQSQNNRFISFARPDGTEIGAVRQITSNSVDYNTTSDERLKTNIQPTAKGLNDLMQIEVKDYLYKDDLNNPQTGFIAQQVYAYYPNAVTPGGDDVKTDPWMMDYGKMTPLLVKAVQEQQAQIEVLMAENEALRIQAAKLNKIEAKLDALLNNEPSTYIETNEK